MHKQCNYMVRFKNYDHYSCRCLNMGFKKNKNCDDILRTNAVRNDKYILPILSECLYTFTEIRKCVMSYRTKQKTNQQSQMGLKMTYERYNNST